MVLSGVEASLGGFMTGNQPLRGIRHHQLQLIVSGLRDGVILIEPDQTLTWANQAALRMHGVERVEDLGATVSEYRARFDLRYRNKHRLPPGDYPMERVAAGEAFDEVTVEVAPAGAPEPQWTHHIRGLVLNDASGMLDCLVLVIDDQTERYDAEQRFERIFAANPAPAIILRLADLRYVKVNRGFLEMTGYREDQVIGRSGLEVDVLENAARRELAVERLREGRTIPQMEATLQLANGGEKLVLVAGQPIEVGNTECMLFTFADLSSRQQAHESLRHSEERFEKAFRLVATPTVVALREDCSFLSVNEAFVRESGYSEAELIGRKPIDLNIWDNAEGGRALEQQVKETGSVRNLEMGLRTRHGHVLNCLVSADTVDIGGQDCVLLTVQDVTERKRTEQEIVAAIEEVMKDTSWFTKVVLDKLARLRRPGTTASAPAREIESLPVRGREVLGLVCQGLDDGAIAESLGLARNTVRNHVASLYRRAHVRSRSALVVWARERGFFGREEGAERLHGPD
ncbi:PAS domain S-box protein [Acetobacteraceae bacterium AT-5844]|nr:PAS domain S-box protein [Acetobacteraceae bacterium AT-5844]